MDDQRKDYSDPKRPPQRNCPKQLQTHNMPTNNVKNIDSTNLVDLLLIDKPRNLPRGTETMLQTNQRYKRTNIYR